MPGPYTRVASDDPGNSGATSAVTIVNAHSSGLEALEYRTFNVRDYGATGDGSTDDTTEIAAAITALNAAGSGVLLFPPGTYKVTTGSFSITVPATVTGYGRSMSVIKTASTTGNLFAVTSNAVNFADIALVHTAISSADHPSGGSTTKPTAGAAIAVTSGGYYPVYRDIAIYAFYNGIDHVTGAWWNLRGSLFQGCGNYAVKIRNTDAPDFGDMSVSDTAFIGDATTGPTAAGIRQESGGGLKVSNCKFNGGAPSGMTNAIDVLITGDVTGVLTVHGCSIENYTSTGVKIATASSGQFVNGSITGNEIVPFTSGTTGVRLTGPSVSNFAITGNAFGATTAVAITDTSHIAVAGNTYSGVTTKLSQSGTNTSINMLD